MAVETDFPATYYTTVPPAQTEEPHLGKKYVDVPKLREIRKRLDSGQLGENEIDNIAGDLLEDVVTLGSDHIGNTIIQKLFERCSQSIKMAMLERIAPYLASIGCHKNGTWAAQK
jgi:protein JSN1